MKEKSSPFYFYFIFSFFKKHARELFFVFLYFVLVLVQLGGLRIVKILDRPSYDSFEAGKVADRDVVLDRDVSVLDREATDLKLSATDKLVPPVFVEDKTVTDELRTRYNALRAVFESIPSMSFDAAFLKMQTALPRLFSEEEFKPVFSASTKAGWLKAVDVLVNRVLNSGYLNLPADRDSMGYSGVLELRASDGDAKTVAFSDMLTIENIDEYLISLAKRYSLGDMGLEGLRIVASRFLQPTVFFDASLTSQKKDSVLKSVEPVVKEFKKGDVIVRKGFVLSQKQVDTLRLLETASALPQNHSFFWESLFLVFVGFSAYLLIFSGFGTGLKCEDSYIYLLYILVLIVLVITFLAYSFFSDSVSNIGFFIPLSIMGFFMSVFFDREAGLRLVLASSLFFLPVMDFEMVSFLFILFCGLFSFILVNNVRSRIDLLKATLYVILSVIPLAAIMLIISSGGDSVLNSLFLASANIFFSGMLVVMILPVAEHVLNAPTRFRLLELSDINTPVLKRMLSAAPGTYSHSLMVAQLSEAACEAIGANGLLARVGAYYHDIGKIEQPEYFVENQTKSNKHDDLNPSLSSAVIKAHARRGVEMALKMGFPRAVVDIIAQHHGDAVIRFFYEEAKKNGSSVLEEDFSYSGDRPASKEAAVVMLADTVEAGVRALAKPSLPALEKRVHSLIMEKMKSGQLDNSPLTMKDIATIEKVFVRFLAANYHKRIEYPDGK
ncbi:HDIG domain-containing metalloprotein [Spirochaetia bacterium 38H-sp]|uniref:HDIG domain-containing metalloprotein n=1 Tax=Rarispira pelagica TaxID=3141764 RepID=A0ABU9UDM1_9SPIR